VTFVTDPIDRLRYRRTEHPVDEPQTLASVHHDVTSTGGRAASPRAFATLPIPSHAHGLASITEAGDARYYPPFEP